MSKRKRGEWFALADDDVREIKSVLYTGMANAVKPQQAPLFEGQAK